MRKNFLIVMLCAFSIFVSAGNNGSDKNSNNKLPLAASFNAYLDAAKDLIAAGEFKSAADTYAEMLLHFPEADKEYYLQIIEILLQDDKFVEIKNLGPEINSAQNDIFPRISSDGQTLYFISSDRPGGYGGDDAWFSKRKSDGSWGKAENFGPQFNTDTHEGILAISNDDNFAIAFGNYEGSFGGGDLFYIVRKGNRWTLPCNLGGKINTSSWESMANLAPDGKSMLFTSDRSGGVGDEDIWVTTLTENGWTTPINLGSTINTTAKEKYPFLSADGKTLYFSSNGHPGLGGQDIFVSRRIGDSWTEWTKPVNLGKFINTVNDDQDLTIPASGDVAYMVRRNQPGGYGMADIYTFELPEDMRPEKVFNIYGNIIDDEGNPVAAIIHFYDKKTGAEITKAQSRSLDGSYTTNLPYGKDYYIVIDMKGYLVVSDEFSLQSKDKQSMKRDYMLQKIKVGLKFELKNIYFDFGKATLRDESKVELDRLYDILSRSMISIELGGHTDNVGSDENNLKLSQDRVNSVKEYLVKKGIPADRINAVGYGESQPIASNDTEEGRQKNRRVEVKITSVTEDKSGGDVVTEEVEMKKKEEAKFDMLAMLRYAAELGGLPKGSPCSNESYFLQDVPLVYKSQPKTYEYDDRNDGYISLKNYIFGGFNAHILNYGNKGSDASWGVGVNFVTSGLDEYYAEYYFSNPSVIKLFAGAGLLYSWQLYDIVKLKLNLLYGFDAKFWTTELGTTKDTYLYGNIPVGVRYLHDIAGFNLGADVIYNINVLKSDKLNSKPSFLKLGVNARWGMFQAGVYLNSGDYVDYFGIRAGICF